MTTSSPEPPGDRSRAPVPSDVRAHQRPRATEETSAGGLVVDLQADPPRAALIGRLDRRGRLMWSLPKGHIENGETREETAVREVAEETGIQGSIIAPLGTIDFWFVADGKRIHKTVHHYLMRAEGGSISDEDPEVVRVDWINLDDVPTKLAYADEKRLVERVPELLSEAE